MQRVPSKDFAESVRLRLGGTATPMAAQLAMQAVAQAIGDGLNEDGEVRLARFGTFRIKTCRARRLVIPGTGRQHLLPDRRVLRFSATRSLST